MNQEKIIGAIIQMFGVGKTLAGKYFFVPDCGGDFIPECENGCKHLRECKKYQHFIDILNEKEKTGDEK